MAKLVTFHQVSFRDDGSFARFATAEAAQAFAVALPSPIPRTVSRLSANACIAARWNLSSDVETAAARGAVIGMVQS